MVNGCPSQLMNSISSPLRYSIFILFFLLSVRFVLVYLNYLTGIVQIAGIIVVIVFFIVVLWRPIWILFLFIACIPLIRGIQGLGIMKVAPLLSFGFSIIYIAWLLKRVFRDNKSIETHTFIGNLVDTLSGLVCLSIIVCFCYYPLAFSLYRLQFASIMGQSDPFWFMEAGFIILQGLFLYRIIGLEIQVIKDFRPFIVCLYCHVVIILFFSIIQLLFAIPIRGGDAIFSPFQDAHSYGGYLVILFFFLIYVGFKKRHCIIELIFSSALLICLYLSGSTSSLISLILIGSLSLFIFAFKKRNNIIFLISIFLGLMVVVYSVVEFTPDNFIKHKYINRLNPSIVLKSKTVTERLRLWDQALGIIRDFPLTGSGIGSFFKISNNYQFIKKVNPGEMRNAHNYYFQFAAELGGPALILFFLILFFAYKKGLQSKNILGVKGLLLGLSAYLISMLSGHHLILSTQQFLFWFILAVISFPGNINSENENVRDKQLSLHIFLFGLIFVVLAGHAANLFYLHKKIKGLDEYGLYKSQVIDKDKMQWAMKYSGREILAESDEFGFSMYAEPENLNSEILEIEIYVNDKLIDHVKWDSKGTIHRDYNIPGIKGQMISIRTSSNDSYNPYKKGLSKNIRENRDQSVAISDIVFKSKDD